MPAGVHSSAPGGGSVRLAVGGAERKTTVPWERRPDGARHGVASDSAVGPAARAPRARTVCLREAVARDAQRLQASQGARAWTRCQGSSLAQGRGSSLAQGRGSSPAPSRRSTHGARLGCRGRACSRGRATRMHGAARRRGRRLAGGRARRWSRGPGGRAKPPSRAVRVTCVLAPQGEMLSESSGHGWCAHSAVHTTARLRHAMALHKNTHGGEAISLCRQCDGATTRHGASSPKSALDSPQLLVRLQSRDRKAWAKRSWRLSAADSDSRERAPDGQPAHWQAIRSA
jgi:hypothetical protein